MRNFPIVPTEQQASLTEDQLKELMENDTRREAFKSDVTGKWKAYQKVNGQYTKWTEGQGYDTPEEALNNL